MECTRGNIAFGVLCFLATSCGVSFSILVSTFFNFICERTGETDIIATELWTIGLAFIIPGFIGLMACCVRVRGLYIAHMIHALLAVGILASLFFTGHTSTGVHSNGPRYCEMTGGQCFCSNDDLQGLLKYFSCGEINRMVIMGLSADAMFYIGGFLTLITAFVSGSFSSPKRNPETTTPGVGLDYLPTAAKQQFSSNPYKRLYE